MALYNSAEGYVYVHPYRTGGTSLRQHLRGAEVLGLHSRAADVRNHFLSQGRLTQWNSSYKIMTIRNPFDWCVSIYHYIKQHATHPRHASTKPMPYDEFIQWLCVQHTKTWPHGSHGYWTLTQAAYDDDSCLIDRFIRLEEIGSALQELRRRFDLANIPLNVVNASHRPRAYRGFYSSESRSMVEGTFEEDLTRFNYEF